ncbi:hypothetical protein GGR51DRAFT_140193 [Nemania sp. FL0031]|nr:hypothetical protein GGR51DRAFT_140193 [Nemania sp. FL0031]
MQFFAIALTLLSASLADAAAAAAAAKLNTYAPGVALSSNNKRSLTFAPELGLVGRSQTGIMCSLNNCYTQGYSNGNAGQNEIYVGSGYSPAACKAACQSRAGCISFAVEQDGSGNCFTEQASVVAEIVEDCGAPFFFYDVGCNA